MHSFLNICLQKRVCVPLFYVLGIILAYFSLGYLQPDEHFQVLEWSRLLDGLPFSEPWEATQSLRHPLLPYLMLHFIHFLFFLGIKSPDFLAAGLRIISFLICGSLQLFCIHVISKALFTHPKRQKTFLLLFISCPLIYYFFARTSSENFGATCLLLSLTLMMVKSPIPKHFSFLLAGLFTIIAFAMRFPMASAYPAHLLCLYYLARDSQWNKMILFFLGLLLGSLLFFWTEHLLYGHWFISPITFLKFNVLSGKAENTFGAHMGGDYLLFFLLVFAPLNLVLAKVFLKGTEKVAATTESFTYHHRRFFSVMGAAFLSFLLVHLKIAHKEFRFLIPMIPLLFIFYGYLVLRFELLSKKRLYLYILCQIPVLGYFFFDYSLQFSVLQKACAPYTWEREHPVVGIWSENLHRFHTFPAFFCGVPGESIHILRDIPVESIPDAITLRKYLSWYLPFVPPPNVHGKPRYIKKDGWFYTTEQRQWLLKNTPLLFTFARYAPPHAIPRGCTLERSEQYRLYRFNRFLPLLWRKALDLKINYYLFCP